MSIMDETVSFKVERDKNIKAREILKEVYNALQEKGYNPINQIVGYILSGDPTYITSHNNARNLIRQIERDELLENIVQNNEEPAGQTVFHFHMHLIPRYVGDNAGFGWNMGKLTDEVRDEILEKMVKNYIGIDE